MIEINGVRKKKKAMRKGWENEMEKKERGENKSNSMMKAIKY